MLKILIIVGYSFEFEDKFHTIFESIQSVHPSSDYTVAILFNKKTKKINIKHPNIKRIITLTHAIKGITKVKKDKFDEVIILTGRDEVNLKEFSLWMMAKLLISKHTLVYPKSTIHIKQKRHLQLNQIIRSTIKYTLKSTTVKTKIALSFIGFLLWLSVGKIYKRVKKQKKHFDILFIRQDAFGDIMMSYPALLSLRKAKHDKTLAVLTSSWSKEFFELLNRCNANKLYDTLLIWDAPWHDKRNKKLLGIKEFFKIIFGTYKLWNYEFDTIIQPVGYGPPVAYAVLLLGKKCYVNVYPEYPMARLMSRKASNPLKLISTEETHIMEQVNLLIEHMGINTDKIYNSKEEKILEIPPTSKEKLRTKIKIDIWRDTTRIGIINVGAGHTLRIIPTKTMARIADFIYKLGFIVVLIGSPKEKELAQQIKSMCYFPLLNLTGNLSLDELAALLEASDLLITSDTGTMHLAALLNSPMVIIYGPGSVTYSRPICEKAEIVKQELGCSGCGDNCYINSTSVPPCISEIKITQILEAINKSIRSL